MKSIQGVSIWKILGSFLVLTMCLSEAHSSDGSPLEKERPVPALVASVGHGDILPVAAHSRDEAALDKVALREQIHTLIALGGKIVVEAVSPDEHVQEEKAGVRRRRCSGWSCFRGRRTRHARRSAIATTASKTF